jgi:hypothetical protein
MFTHQWTLIKYWGIFEYAPFAGGERKRCLIIRERQSECQEILNSIEKSNINFEVYKIEGLT